jgi:hypothetical protein
MARAITRCSGSLGMTATASLGPGSLHIARITASLNLMNATASRLGHRVGRVAKHSLIEHLLERPSGNH